jgi:hypothetical protein
VIPWQTSLRNVEGHDSDAGDELVMGNGSSFCCVFAGIFSRAIAHKRGLARDHARVARMTMLIAPRHAAPSQALQGALMIFDRPWSGALP